MSDEIYYTASKTNSYTICGLISSGSYFSVT